MKTEKATYRIVVNEYEEHTDYYPMISKDGTIWSHIASKLYPTMDKAEIVIKKCEKLEPKITVLEKRGDKYIELTDKEI